MATKVSNSINEQIFHALKVSENSGVPSLFVSNPGVGKSSTVEMFAKIRGYHLLTLRGNSTTADEITGYDTVPEGVREGQHRAAVGLRPSWFQQLMDIHDKGGKSILFLDEITTASAQVQEALLHIVFERSCKDEKIPDDTLIVAAGNYALNLDSSANLVSPIMNRFTIFNLIPTSKDIRTFLNNFAGASVNKDNIPDDKMANLRKLLEEIDKQELTVTKPHYYRAGEFLEIAICQTAERLASVGSTQKVDWAVNDLSGIYSGSAAVDAKLYGFMTLRTLYYLEKWALSTYICFGTHGLKSDNLINAIDGLCGIGITKRNGSNTETTVNYIGREFFNAISACIQEIEKMNNTSLPEYETFLDEIFSKESALSKEELVALNSKLKEMTADKTLTNIERPISEYLIKQSLKSISTTSIALRNVFKKKTKISSEKDLTGEISPEQFGGYIETWNLIADVMNLLTDIVGNSKNKYQAKEKTLVNKGIEDINTEVLSKLRSLKKLITVFQRGIILPDLRDLKVIK